MQDKILTIDQGTSSAKAIIFDRYGAILGSNEQMYGVQNLGGGYVEQNPEELFGAAVQSARAAMGDCLPEEIAALGISVQTGAFLLWHKETGKPLSPVISWQCKRGRKFLKTLSSYERQQLEDAVGGSVEEDTVPAKLAQVFAEIPSLHALSEEKKLLFGTMESWLLWRLTGGKCHKSDITNACITRLYLEKENCWNKEALDILGISPDIFPKVVDNDTYLGKVEIPGLSGIRIHGVIGDSAAAMFGEYCWEQGQSKITYGTGASFLVHLGNAKECFGLQDTFLGWRIHGICNYVWEGTLPHVGSMIKWLEKLGVITSPQETECLAKELKDNGGVYFLPDIAIGETEQNLFWGMNFLVDRRHLARAVLESIAFRIRDMQKVLSDASLEIQGEIRADGGVAGNDFLMQFQADILDRSIVCNRHPDISAFGVFLITALGSELLSQNEIKEMKHQSRTYRPDMLTEDRERLLNEWERVKKAIK